MTTTSSPLQVYLGSNNGEHSLVVCSSKGVNWHNVHPDLESILLNVTPEDILHLSIGCEGRYWIKYRCGKRVHQKITPEAWNETHPHLQRRLRDISKVSFGLLKEIWVYSAENKPPRHFLKVRPPMAAIMLPEGVGYPAAENIEFVEFGYSLDNFVIKVGGRVVLGGHKGILAVKNGPNRHKNIIAAALSPMDNAYYFVSFEDGTYAFSLPDVLSGFVKTHLPQEPSSRFGRGEDIHMQRHSPTNAESEASLGRSNEAISASAFLHQSEEVPIPLPLWLLSRVSSFRIPPIATSLISTLRALPQLDSERIRVELLFSSSWKRSERPCPSIHGIYEIEMPGSLVVTYCAYRLNVSSTIGGDNACTEQELFHGTSRCCSVGNKNQSDATCNSQNCRLCKIIKQSFKTDQAGTVVGRTVPRFGQGIYISQFSSKADQYSTSSTKYKAMLLCRVVLGRSCTLTSKTDSKSLSEAPDGYDSVLGKVGGSRDYDVHAVYKNEAILPAYLIVYK